MEKINTQCMYFKELIGTMQQINATYNEYEKENDQFRRIEKEKYIIKRIDIVIKELSNLKEELGGLNNE